jgi:hypothetical protein
MLEKMVSRIEAFAAASAGLSAAGLLADVARASRHSLISSFNVASCLYRPTWHYREINRNTQYQQCDQQWRVKSC